CKEESRGRVRSRAVASRPPILFRSGELTMNRPPSDQLLDFLAPYDLKVGELALRLREFVFNQAPEANEKLFRSYAVSLSYSLTNRWTDGFCHIVVYRNHVNLGFNKGAQLPDPNGLLEGTGKMIRHLRITSADDLKKSFLLRFIRSAIKLSKAELKLRQASQRGA